MTRSLGDRGFTERRAGYGVPLKYSEVTRTRNADAGDRQPAGGGS